MIASLITGLASVFGPVVSEFVEDKDKANELKFKLATMGAEHAQAITLAQIEVNKTEASSNSKFVAGWRPGAGWVCVAAMAFNYVLLPILNWMLLVAAVIADMPDLPTLPVLNFGEIMPVLLGMLGLGGLRTREKEKGVARER